MSPAENGRVPSPGTASVVVWWLPVGAGGHVVRHTSRWWEVMHAHRAGRPPRRLLHTAVEVRVDGRRFTLEMAPEWAGSPSADRGVVVTGPVGVRALGVLRWFRYEIRCWRDGVIPDLAWAERRDEFITDADTARALLERARRVPALTWGRRVGPVDDMWNSNSFVAWLLLGSGLDVSGLVAPPGARAPGWDAGLAVQRDPALAGTRVGCEKSPQGRRP